MLTQSKGLENLRLDSGINVFVCLPWGAALNPLPQQTADCRIINYCKITIKKTITRSIKATLL
jgi:hypothetical protein